MGTEIDIDWNKVLNKGAEAFGTAFGTSFGTALGQQLGIAVGKGLATIIFGSGGVDDEFRNEMARAVQRINFKLDQIISMLQLLPEVIRSELKQARIDEIKIQAQTCANKSRAAILVFQAYETPKTEHIMALAAVGDTCIDISETLLRTSPEAYAPAMFIFACGVSAYTRAARHDKAQLAGLSSRAATLASECVTPIITRSADGKSFHDVLARLDAEGPQARDEIAAISRSSREYLLSWQRMPASELGAEGVAEHGCWFQLLPDGRFLGDTLYHVSPIPNFNSATDMARLRFKASPYWAAIEGPAKMEHYLELAHRLNVARSVAQKFEVARPQLAEAVAALTSFREFLYDLAELQPERTPAAAPTKLQEHEHGLQFA